MDRVLHQGAKAVAEQEAVAEPKPQFPEQEAVAEPKPQFPEQEAVAEQEQEPQFTKQEAVAERNPFHQPEHSRRRRR